MSRPETPAQEPIAIVGIGCRFPGRVNDPDGFWRLLRDGVDAVGDVPPDRWSVDAYYDPTGKRPGSISARRGAFIEGLDTFDPAFFGISPREATRMDPQQRMLLEVAWESLEDAGQIASKLAGTPVGVFVGISWNDYSTIQLAAGSLDSIDAHTGAGGAMSIAANRISHAFDFRGPSVAVDTACSSALVAVHLACNALWNGECSMALAGGVNAMLIPAYFIALSRLNMLSPDGQCRAFDADGKGYVRGEGAGLVALRPLSAAIADGDRIYAVIRGTAVNQDGHTNGITVPSQAAQETVVREACRRAGVQPRDIHYVEAHGTGTPVGDPIEAHALGTVVGDGRHNGDACVLGSVKTNIGHLESAAGIAGLIKTTLALLHEQIPPNLHFATPHPGIPFDRLGLRVATRLEPWKRSATPRYAGVNSFGFGGTNAHVILGEAPLAAVLPAETIDAAAPRILPISARSASALRAHVQAHAHRLAAIDSAAAALDDSCRTAANRRDHLEHRLTVVAPTAAAMGAHLEKWLAGEHIANVSAGRIASAANGIGFVFCGQGAQWWGMARGLLRRNRVFRESVERTHELLARDASWSLLDELRRDEAFTRVHETNILQPAVFAIQVALADLWRSWGVMPAAVVGHSMGEVAAAYVAGALTIETATRLIYHRARVQHQAAGTGAMLAVGLARADAEQTITGYAGRLWVAGINGPSSVTIGGEIQAVAELASTLASRGVFHRAVRMEMACHTPHMDHLEGEFWRAIRDLPLQAPTIPFYSAVKGARVTATLDADYWWANVRQPVDFLGAAERMAADGLTQFIELGPHPVLASGLAEVLSRANTPGVILPSLRRGDDDAEVMLRSLGGLHTSGHDVRWSAVVGTGGRVVGLPKYPWQRQRYWNESPRARGARVGAHRSVLLGSRQPGADGCWETTLDSVRYPFLADHVVQDSIVVPGAALTVLAMMAAEIDLPGEGRAVVEEIEFAKPLFIPTEGAQTVQVTLRADGGLEIHSKAESREESWTRHAHARVRRETAKSAPSHESLAAIRARCAHGVSTESLYATLAAKGIHLGPSFQAVAELWSGEREALALIEAPATIAGDLDVYPLHPVLLDACLQAFITAIPTRHAGLHLPVEIGRLRLYARPVDGKFWVHVRLTSWSERSVVGDAVLLDDGGTVIGEATACRVRAVHDADASSRPDGDLFYEFQWQLESAGDDPADFLPAPRAVAESAKETFETSIAADVQRYNEYYERAEPRLEALAMRHVASAFAMLGWEWRVAETIRPRELAARLGVAARHERLFAMLLSMLAEEGTLVADGDVFRVRRAPHTRTADASASAIGADFPWAAPELALLQRCGGGLAGVLRGELASLELLFPDGDLSDVEHLNRDFPVLRSYNAVAARMVAELVAHLPSDRVLRILEIGAGTGALTSHVLDVLPAGGTEYVHSDLSPFFAREARQKFASHAHVRYEVLDIEKNPAVQGFSNGSFDLVLAGNVLHATADLPQTLGHVRELLSPGGMVLILEATRFPRWVELIWSLTDGWWKFADDVRAGFSSPLMGSTRWLSALGAAGFTGAASVTDSRRVGQNGHAVYLAQAPRQSSASPATATGTDGHWLIMADRRGAGGRIAAGLRKRGVSCSLRERPDSVGEREIAALLASARAEHDVDEVLYCWSLDASSSHDSSASDVADDQLVGAEGAFHLARALMQSPDGSALPRLTFLTAGAQTLSGELPAVSQAPLWGFARVLVAEHPEFRTRLIDVAANGDFDADVLADELLEGSEEECAHRGSRRYVHRLASRADLRAPVHGSATAGEQAFALYIATPGVLDTLEFRATTRRAPPAGEVEVEVHTAGLNFKDVMTAMGMLPDHALDASYGGFTLGREFSGRVVTVGEGVTNVAVGDEVLGLGSGAFGSFVTTFAGAVVKRPPTLSPEEAAAIPLVFVTAHYALNTIGHMKAGERVLIHSASGGVGLAAIQLARRAGAEIFATAGSDEKRQLVRSLGVRHVMDSRSLSFAEEIMAVTGGEGVDIVLNALPGDAIEKGLSVLRANGRFLEIGRRDIWQNAKIGLKHFTRNLTLTAIDVDRSGREQPEVVARALREVVEGLADGSLKPLPVTRYEPTDIAAAFRLMGQSRHVGKLVVAFHGRTVPLAARAPDETPLVYADGTYLLTGGLGGFGLVVAEWLVHHGARHLVLMGRSGAATAAAQDAVTRLRAAGAHVEIATADVTREQDVTRVLHEIRATMPPLRGVMHMAMVLDDALVQQLDLERFRRVMSPKVEGAWTLHQRTQQDPLDWFVMFSSAAAVFGNPGQANYAAANMFLGALAQHRRASGLPALSVDWGRIGGVGYVARHDRIGEFLDRQGYPAIAPEEALSSLGRLMRSGVAEASVLRVNWPRWRRFFPASLAISKRFAKVAAAGVGPTAGTATTERQPGRAAVGAAPASERAALLIALVSGHLGRVLGTAPELLESEARLTDLGLDSLMAVELRNRLEREFGVDIPVMTLLQGPTVSDLATVIGAAIGEGAVVAESDVLRVAPVVAETPRGRETADVVAPAPERLATTASHGRHVVAPAARANGNASSTTWLRRNGPSITSAALRMAARIEIDGLERIPRDGPMILAANHVNALDALLMFAFMPRRASSFVKESLQQQPVVGWLIRELLDAIWVTRGTGDESALAQAIAVVQGGGALAINPEGTRSRTGVLQKGQPGAAFIAAQTGAPIIPVVAFGHERLLRNLGRFTRSRVRVRVGHPIRLPAARTPQELGQNTDLLMRAMASMLPEEYRGMYAERPDGAWQSVMEEGEGAPTLSGEGGTLQRVG